jgi:hypothetical protein
MDAFSKSDQEVEMIACFKTLTDHGIEPNHCTYIPITALQQHTVHSIKSA